MRRRRAILRLSAKNALRKTTTNTVDEKTAAKISMDIRPPKQRRGILPSVFLRPGRFAATRTAVEQSSGCDRYTAATATLWLCPVV